MIYDVKTFEPGEIILKEGEIGKGFCILEDGELQVIRGEKILNEITSRGSMFGELSELLMQIHLLFRRFEQHQQIVWNSDKGAVQDRTIYEDTIFARMPHEAGFINQRDYDTYLGHFKIMKRYLVYPDILIYLRVNPKTCLERIGERGRKAETAITLDYMENLNQGYEYFIDEMTRYTRVLTLDWNQYLEVEEVVQRISEMTADKRKFLRDLRK